MFPSTRTWQPCSVWARMSGKSCGPLDADVLQATRDVPRAAVNDEMTCKVRAASYRDVRAPPPLQCLTLFSTRTRLIIMTARPGACFVWETQFH